MYLPKIPVIVALLAAGSCIGETGHTTLPVPATEIPTGEGEDMGYVSWILPYRCGGYDGSSVNGLTVEAQCRHVFEGDMCDGITGRVLLPEGVLPTAEDRDNVRGIDGQLLSEIPEQCYK